MENISWEEEINNDWSKTKKCQPGWKYTIKNMMRKF